MADPSLEEVANPDLLVWHARHRSLDSPTVARRPKPDAGHGR
jgi:hypothetical protein